MSTIRRKVFISYHHADQEEVEDFCETFDNGYNTCIARALGVSMDQNIIDSDDTEYIMRRIRELYLEDSTVTIVLIGKCTWARRYIDWEIQSSLRHGDTTTPNGLIGIVLPSAGNKPIPPDRLKMNLKGENSDEGYARWYWYPQRKEEFANWLEDAFQARTNRSHLIINPRERYVYNRTCL